MPRDWKGQQITFASEFDPDWRYSSFIWIRVTHTGDTIQRIAAQHGHGNLAWAIAKLNNIRSPLQKLKKGRKLRLPGTLQGPHFDVHAQDGNPPYIVGGYAKFTIDDRPGRVGINRFTGYDPIQMAVPITFDSWIERDGTLLEDKIRVLERMAGRGDFHGAATGGPAVIRLSTTDNHGNVTWLLPFNYQWSPQNTTAPLWRITGIQWDQTPLRNGVNYKRLRQNAVVTVQQYTPVVLTPMSTADRARAKSLPVTVGSALIGLK